jgi:predicted nucleic acid-binding protein
MSVFYLDTSVIVKRYRTEEGTDFVDMLFDEVINSNEHSLATSTISILEFIAAMRRIQKAGIISEDDFEDAISMFRKDSEHFSLRPFNEDLLTKSINVVMDHSLRTVDSLHIATVLELKEMMSKIDEETILVSNDNEMCNAGKKEGLDVLKPSDKDRLISILDGPQKE